jgi:hypothetical protein
MFSLIVSLLLGHNVTCKNYHVDKKSAVETSNFYSTVPGDFVVEHEECKPGFKVIGSSFSNIQQVASQKVCEALGKNWVKQHDGLVDIKATYSCTKSED